MQFGYIHFAIYMTFAIFKVIFAGFWMYLFFVARIGILQGIAQLKIIYYLCNINDSNLLFN